MSLYHPDLALLDPASAAAWKVATDEGQPLAARMQAVRELGYLSPAWAGWSLRYALRLQGEDSAAAEQP